MLGQEIMRLYQRVQQVSLWQNTSLFRVFFELTIAPCRC